MNLSFVSQASLTKKVSFGKVVILLDVYNVFWIDGHLFGREHLLEILSK